MDKLTSLFNTIGEMLNASSWFQLIQWPFWTLLVILAFCGVYTARFQKKTLLCLACEAGLKLACIYIVAAAGYILLPSFMADFSQLPFYSVSAQTLSLVNPLGLLDRLTTALPTVAVRLYTLLYFINIAGIVIDYKPANFLSWLFFQTLVCIGAVLLYAGFHSAIIRFWPGSVDVLYKVMAVLLLLGFTIVFALKLFYSVTFISKKDNPAFMKIYQFLTKQNYGKQFTVTAIAFLLAIAFLVIASLTGHNRMFLDSVSYPAFAINTLMCMGTLYIFSKYYNG